MHTTMNLTNLDYLKLMADGDRDMEMTMLDMLIEELPTEFDKMKALHSSQDWPELSKVAHKMKSTLAFIGNDDLTAANLKIEQLTKQEENPPKGNDVQLLGEMMEQFSRLMPGVVVELRAVAGGY